MLLAIEDLHWADGATRDFITFLVRSAREEPLCLVVTYRSDELHRRHPLRPLLAELERAAGVDRLALERFDRDEVAAQLAGILQEPAPADLAERLYARSQGNPLYTEELLAALEDGDSWLLPETLRDVLLARIERLSPPAQAIVRIAAVLDRPATHALLEAVVRPGARRGHGGRARGGRPPGPRDRRARACTRSATRSSARPCTATCCPARTPRCTRRSPRRSTRAPSCSAT